MFLSLLFIKNYDSHYYILCTHMLCDVRISHLHTSKKHFIAIFKKLLHLIFPCLRAKSIRLCIKKKGRRNH